MTRVDVYPVGVLAELKRLRRVYDRQLALPPIAKKHVWRNLRRMALRILRLVRNRDWRTVKCYFNGYLAEPTPFPEHMRRCGSGWTKQRALKSLERHGYPQA